MEEFGRHYYSCNSKKYGTNLGHTSCGMNVTKLKSPDSIITLAFAIMMLNTDLHTPKIKGKFVCTKEHSSTKIIVVHLQSPNDTFFPFQLTKK